MASEETTEEKEMKPWDIIDETRLREMRAASMTKMQIAEEFGVSPRWVEYRCRDLKIPSALGPKGGLAMGSAKGGAATRYSNGWESAASDASQCLLAAIQRHHPERVAA